MIIAQMRSDFERWQIDFYGYRQDYIDAQRGDGDYARHEPMRDRWIAWQASRAALVVTLTEKVKYRDDFTEDELNEQRRCDYDDGWVDGVNFVVKESINALRAAGITVKEG